MIVDDLAERSEWVRKFLEKAHIFRLPFSMYPFDESDGQPGFLWKENLIPRGLVPTHHREGKLLLNGNWARPPYNMTVLVGAPKELGVLFVWTQDCNDVFMNAVSQAAQQSGIADGPVRSYLERHKVSLICDCLLVGIPHDRIVATYSGYAIANDGGVVMHPGHACAMAVAAIRRPSDWPEYQGWADVKGGQATNGEGKAAIGDIILVQAQWNLRVMGIKGEEARERMAEASGRLKGFFSEGDRWMDYAADLALDGYNITRCAVSAFSY